jgi:hypothetical protein
MTKPIARELPDSGKWTYEASSTGYRPTVIA